MPRLSKKRSDRRWEAPDGTIWASKFEYSVFDKLRSLGYVVSKCEKGPDCTFAYHSPVKSGRCLECDSCQVVQQRSYTPDLLVIPKADMGKPAGDVRRIYLETKGYFPASKRSLFRAFQQTGPDIDLRVLAERDNWVTKGKSKLSDYFKRYLKTVPFAVWTGDLPDEWKQDLLD